MSYQCTHRRQEMQGKISPVWEILDFSVISVEVRARAAHRMPRGAHRGGLSGIETGRPFELRGRIHMPASLYGDRCRLRTRWRGCENGGTMLQSAKEP